MSLLVKSDIHGHKPLPAEVYIAESPFHGHGIFAAKSIPADYDFGITHVADTRFPNGFIRTPFGGFINHSFEPNCRLLEIEDTLHIKTIKSIDKDQELTIDYRPWYSEEEVATYK
jgi:SET domain-containing protein